MEKFVAGLAGWKRSLFVAIEKPLTSSNHLSSRYPCREALVYPSRRNSLPPSDPKGFLHNNLHFLVYLPASAQQCCDLLAHFLLSRRVHVEPTRHEAVGVGLQDAGFDFAMRVLEHFFEDNEADVGW